MNTAAIAERLDQARPDLKAGTLRRWGVWFGRPYDNLHRLVRSSARGDTLVLEFDQGERLTVTAPAGLAIAGAAFSLRAAARIRWEWCDDGRSGTAAPRLFEEFVNEGGRITVATNADPGPGGAYRPSPHAPAVELV